MPLQFLEDDAPSAAQSGKGLVFLDDQPKTSGLVFLDEEQELPEDIPLSNAGPAKSPFIRGHSKLPDVQTAGGPIESALAFEDTVRSDLKGAAAGASDFVRDTVGAVPGADPLNPSTWYQPKARDPKNAGRLEELNRRDKDLHDELRDIINRGDEQGWQRVQKELEQIYKERGSLTETPYESTVGGRIASEAAEDREAAQSVPGVGAAVARGFGHFASVAPVAMGTGGAGLPLVTLQSMGEAESEARLQKAMELRAQGVTDEAEIAKQAEAAGGNASMKTALTTPVYLGVGKAVAGATGKALGSTVSPLVRTAAQFTTAAAANVATGATLRAIEGENPRPTLESATGDILWAVAHAVGEFHEASDVAQKRAQSELDRRAAKFAQGIDEMTAAAPANAPQPQPAAPQLPNAENAPEIASQKPAPADDLPALEMDPDIAAQHAENIRLAKLEDERAAAVPDNGVTQTSSSSVQPPSTSVETTRLELPEPGAEFDNARKSAVITVQAVDSGLQGDPYVRFKTSSGGEGTLKLAEFLRRYTPRESALQIQKGYPAKNVWSGDDLGEKPVIALKLPDGRVLIDPSAGIHAQATANLGAYREDHLTPGFVIGDQFFPGSQTNPEGLKAAIAKARERRNSELTNRAEEPTIPPDAQESAIPEISPDTGAIAGVGRPGREETAGSGVPIERSAAGDRDQPEALPVKLPEVAVPGESQRDRGGEGGRDERLVGDLGPKDAGTEGRRTPDEGTPAKEAASAEPQKGPKFTVAENGVALEGNLPGEKAQFPPVRIEPEGKGKTWRVLTPERGSEDPTTGGPKYTERAAGLTLADAKKMAGNVLRGHLNLPKSMAGKLPPAPQGGADIIDAILGEVGKIRGTRQYRDRGETLPPEYDGVQELPKAWRSVLFTQGRGVAPDEAAQALYDIGMLKSPHADAMWQEIAGAIKTRHSAGKEAKEQAKDQRAQTRQFERFDPDALEPIREGKDEPAITAGELVSGDVVKVGKENFKVTHVDEDGTVTLEDGKTYGRQTLGPGGAIAAELVQLSPERDADSSDPVKGIDPKTGEVGPVYHGSAGDFETFDPEKIGSASDPGFFAAGFYHTPRIDLAKEYGPNVLRSYVKLQNPIVVDRTADRPSISSWMSALGRRFPDLEIELWNQLYPDPDSPWATEQTNTAGAAVWLRDQLRAKGVDGVMVYDEKGLREVVAFDPSQIRSEKIRKPTADTPFSRRRPGPGEKGGIPSQAKDPETYWRGVFENVAPGPAKDLALRLGDPAELVKAGMLKASELEGTETAAYVAKENAIYLLDKATGSSMRDATMLDVLHESGEAWWDSLSPTVRRSLEKLWAAEVENQTGPLFDAGGLRPEVNKEVLDTAREWFAERTAHDNLEWAKRRAGAAEHDGTLVGRLAAGMRRAVLKVREALGQKPRDVITRSMREFLQRGFDAGIGSDSETVFSRRDQALPAPTAAEAGKAETVPFGTRLPMLPRLVMGTADVIDRIPQLKFLARAIRKHVDRTRMFQGALTAPFRAWEGRWNRAQRKQALSEFESFQRVRDQERNPDLLVSSVNQRVPAAMSWDIRKNASAAGRELLDLWDAAATRIQRRNLAANVMVKAEKGWRPIGTVQDYFPRTIKPDILRKVLRGDKKALTEIAGELQAAGLIGSPEEVVDYLNKRLRTKSRFDHFGNIEAARQVPMPTKAYDYSFNAARRYLMAWSERMAQIEAFGQKTVAGSKDAFDMALDRAGGNKELINYLSKVRHLAYNERTDSDFQTTRQFLTTLSAGLQLGNYVTMGVNVASGLAYNATTFGWLNSMKGFWELRRLGRAIDNAHEKGILLDDLTGIDRDAQASGSRAVQAAAALTKGLLKVSLYDRSEALVRSHSMASGRAFLFEYLRAKPASWKAQYFERWFRRNNLDPARLAAEQGNGTETDRFLREASNLSQGGYRYDQVPAYVDSQWGRFLFKYFKWGTQAARNFTRNVLSPLWETKFLGAREWRDAVRYVTTVALVGAGIEELKERWFGSAKVTATLKEIQRTASVDQKRAFALAVQKFWHATQSAGAFGVLGNYAQGVSDLHARLRYKTPLDPAPLSPVKGVGELLITAFEEGRVTLDNLSNFLGKQVSMYRTLKAAASRALVASEGAEAPTWAKDERTRQEVSWLNGVLRRFMEEHEFSGPTLQGGSKGATPTTQLRSEMKRALMRGDSPEARQDLREIVQSFAPAQRKNVQNGLESSVRANQPIRFYGQADEKTRAGFLQWAQQRLDPVDYERILRLDQRYRAAATDARIVDFGRARRPSEKQIDSAIERRQLAR